MILCNRKINKKVFIGYLKNLVSKYNDSFYFLLGIRVFLGEILELKNLYLIDLLLFLLKSFSHWKLNFRKILFYFIVKSNN